MTETTIGKPGTRTPGNETAPEHPETTPAGYGRGGGEDRGYRAGDYAQHGLGQTATDREKGHREKADRTAIEKQRREKPVREGKRVLPADPKRTGG